MFGIFKKKKSSQSGDSSRVVLLCELYVNLSNDITNLYQEFPDANPAEIHFFAMSATSVFAQGFGEHKTNAMHDLIERFTEQSVANLLFHMPKADYSRVHNAYIARFRDYAALVTRAFNARTNQESQDSSYLLVVEMDSHIGVDRGAFAKSVAGLEIAPLLAEFAVKVSDAMLT